MDVSVIQIIALTYGVVGIISLMAYWPTIRDLLNKKPSANTESYVIWGFTTFVTFMYSIFVLPDFLFRMISGLNFLICVTIAILSVHLKRQGAKIPKELPALVTKTKKRSRTATDVSGRH